MKGKLEYIGKTELIQFNVVSWLIMDKDKDNEEVRAVLRFQRIFFNHLATTYVPSFCILLLAECAVFFKKEHFKTSIPVTITTMLGK